MFSSRVLPPPGNAAKPLKLDWVFVKSADELGNFLEMNPSEFRALDFETDGLEGEELPVYCGAVTSEQQIAVFPPEAISALYSCSNTSRYIFHNANFDLKICARAGFDLHERFAIGDTRILSHLADENFSEGHGLSDLVEKLYGDKYKDAYWGVGPERKIMYQRHNLDTPENAERMYAYCATDVYYTKQLWIDLMKKLFQQDFSLPLVDLVHRTQKALFYTELHGIKMDSAYVDDRIAATTKLIEDKEHQLREMLAPELALFEGKLLSTKVSELKMAKAIERVKANPPKFNYDSPAQLADFLYFYLNLPEQLNAKRQRTADKDALNVLATMHPAVELIQSIRAMSSVLSKFLVKLQDMSWNGRVYPHFDVSGTKTGRLSHSKPNMAQLPREGGIRGIFVPDPGHVFISADYKSLEVYVEAHFTKDKQLLSIIHDKLDKHQITADAIQMPRSTAKTVNFLLQYHGTHRKLKQLLSIPEEEAERIVAKYWETYSGCRDLKAKTNRLVDAGKPIINPFGRRRRFPLEDSRKEWSKDYRQAYNALIQGTGSDITCLAFCDINDALLSKGIGRALFTVHDEIIISVKREHALEGEKMLVEAMVNAGRKAGLSVELAAEPNIMYTKWED